MKIQKAYSNKELIEALKDSKEIFECILTEFDLDDEQLKTLNKYQQLTQFERDVLYLYSQISVNEIAKLYGCSKQLIYDRLREIKRKL